jgi:hypothetical protein
MTQLLELGIIKKDGKSAKIFAEICPDIFAERELSPAQFVNRLWAAYTSYYPSNNSVNGNIFEFIIAAVLLREGIKPFHRQVKLAFVPGIDFDLILLPDTLHLVSLSLKTSFRERYKQADLEAMALKNVHRQAKCYLLTLEPTEAGFIKTKISTGEVQFLDEAIAAKSEEFDSLIRSLANLIFKENHQQAWLAGGILIK